MNKKAFTLVELLVGIIISSILMISIGYIVSTGIGGITAQKQVLNNIGDFDDFSRELINIFDNIDTSFSPKLTSSGVIVKIKQNYDKGGFAYIGEIASPINNNNGIYCKSGSEDINTKHIFIKTFIPDFDIVVQKDHKINGIGKGIFGYNPLTPLSGGILPDKVYLNNPTGTGSSGTIDFISDTLNNRILYKSGSKVYELLNADDGLLEPTGLYYDVSSGSLYIANSGRGEILKLSSKKYTTTPELVLTGIAASNIAEFNIKFFDQNGNKNITNKGNIEIENHTIVSGDNYSKSGNILTFTYSGGTSQTFNNNYIKVSNLQDFSGTGIYYIKLDINHKSYPFFTQGDDNLLTKDDNTLEIIEKDISKYYTKINGIGSYDVFTNYNSYINYEKKYDYILKTPIKKLEINYNPSTKLLKLILVYYKRYNCYNLDDKTERKIILYKKFN